MSQFERLDAARLHHNARAMLFAQDAANRVHAVIYVVRDRHAVYHLLGGADPELRPSGASSMLMWEAILRARRQPTPWLRGLDA